MFSREACSPEQSRALDVLEEAIPLIKELAVSEIPTLDDLCIKDAKYFLATTITTSDIPRGNNWVWNQSRAKIATQDLTENIKLSFHKLNTRKIKSSTTPPFHKLWVFSLHIMPPDKHYSFLWCERGLEKAAELTDEIVQTSPEKTSPENSPSIDDLCLKEFSFLSPFVSEEIATSLGWLDE